VNKRQWIVVGIVCFVMGVNMSIVFVPASKSQLWVANAVLLCVCSGLYYVLRNKNI